MNPFDRFVTWCENHQGRAALLAGGLMLAIFLVPGQVPA